MIYRQLSATKLYFNVLIFIDQNTVAVDIGQGIGKLIRTVEVVARQV